MNTKVEKLENNNIKLEVTVDVDAFKEAIKKAYKKNSGKYNIPGFRKGKAPQHIIEKYYGEGIFFEEAVNIICDETYPKAIKENDISPVDYPELDVVQIGKDKDLIYTATVTVRPEVTLGEYKGVEVTKTSYEVTEEDINKSIDEMRDKNARIVTKEEGTVENGNIVNIDFEGFDAGVPFEGGKGEDYELTIGSGTFIPGFEEQLIGMALNETKEINVTFPEQYHAENLKGKEVMFKVTVKGLKAKELPALDDEFVKDVSEFDTIDDLKADLKKKQEEANEQKSKRDLEETLLNKIADASTVEIPTAMINREIDYMVQDMDYRLQYQGITLEQYAQMLGTTIDDMKKDFTEPATSKVKMNLVLETIAKAENITASEEEIDARAGEVALQYGQKDVEKMKQAILSSEKAMLTEEIVNKKVVEFLVAQSKIA